MKTIFITISRGSLIRNFFQSGIIAKLLERDLKVVVLTPHYRDKEIFQKFEHQNLFFEPLIAGERKAFDKILMEFSKGVLFSKTVLARYKYRFLGRNPRRIFYMPRVAFFYFFRFFPNIKKIIQKIDFIFSPAKQHDYLFDKYKPEILFVTDFMNSPDSSVMKSAKRKNVRIIGMPKSWDNLSKILFKVKADKIFVWGEFGKKEAIAFQDCRDNEIDIVGVPQFDYYKKENLMEREKFCAEIGLAADKNIIFYGSTGVHCQYEYEYIDLILEFLKRENIEAQILIRPHLAYIDDDKKFSKYKNNKNIVIYKSKQNLNLKDRWDLSDDHLRYLFNSIYHSKVCINIASTLTLDSLAIGTPVINIKFDNRAKEMRDSVCRFYETDYVDAIANFGGTWLARSEKEYFQSLKEILVEGRVKKEKTEAMIDYFLYKNDNKAGDRIVENILLELVKI